MMTRAERNYAKNLGKQVGKGNVLYCPYCKEIMVIEYTPGKDQDLMCTGDYENILFCPHCDTSIELIVTLGRNKGKWADHILNETSGV